MKDLKIGHFVYHKNIYDYKERMKVVGIRETTVELEGDYSGGTALCSAREWMSLDGVSYVYNYGRKRKFRNEAIAISTLALPITDRNQSPELKCMFDLLDMVYELTLEVE